jgi:sugar/nucleoside kinase (ribokinase family)
MKPFDILVVGELNVDLILGEIPTLPQLGKEVLAEQMHLVLGSSSAIFASNIASLGARTAFVGKLGKDDFGRFVVDCLEAKQIHTDYIVQDEDLTTGASIILSYPEERAILTYKGAMDELTLEDIPGEAVSNARHLHLSSYYLQKGIQDSCPHLFKTAKEEGLTTSLDTNWDPEERWGSEILDLLPHVDVFLPNKNEALHISHQETVEKALKHLARYSPTVVIKLGKQGAIAVQSGDTYRAGAFDATEIDAVGAGDSFDAGFLFQYLQGSDIQRSLEYGNLCGALSVTKAGGTAAFTSPQQIERDMERLSG